jgi:ABC-type sulfate transport system permease subunit
MASIIHFSSLFFKEVKSALFPKQDLIPNIIDLPAPVSPVIVKILLKIDAQFSINA